MRELVVWASGGRLTADESRRVREHVARCPECASRLAFTGEVESSMRTSSRAHPDPETIVGWAEDAASLPAAERAWVDAHVETCETCAAEVEILRGLEVPAAAPSRVATPAGPSLGERLSAFLLTPFRSPVPALATTLLAVLVGVWWGREASDGTSPPGEVFVQAPAILVDSRGTVRGSGEGASQPPAVDPASPLLVLELTELAGPPVEAAEYFVRIDRGPAGSGRAPRPEWETRIMGREFAATYTIALRPPRTALGAGDHVVRVIAPGGEVVFEATFTVP